MMMRHLLFILAALAFGCGTTHAAGPGQEALVGGFPSEPYDFQKRPGKDGRCSKRAGPPHVIVKGGGCWLWVDMSLEECAKAEREGDYEVVHEGRCYYPAVELRKREPTSSLMPWWEL